MITLTAKIHITANSTIEINRRNVISIESSNFDRSDLRLPSFGIISNTGRIEFNDFDGRVLRLAEENSLTKGLQCEIFITNTLADGVEQRVGDFETEQWDYDYNNKVVSVSLKDDLEEWQDINVSALSYDPRNSKEQNCEWVYRQFWQHTDARKNGNYKMQSFDELVDATKKILKNTYIKYPFYETANLWAQWTKLCEVCQLHIYKDEYGTVVCRYNGGN